MLRVVLTVLLALPMLVPPGMCVCQFVPCGHARAGETAAPHDSGVEDGSCRCASKSRRALADGVQPLGKADPGRRGPVPDDHLPGCPASVQAAVQLVSFVADAVPALDLPAVDWLAAVPTTCPAAPPERHRPAAVTAPPLFVTHCSLVI